MITRRGKGVCVGGKVYRTTPGGEVAEVARMGDKPGGKVNSLGGGFSEVLKKTCWSRSDARPCTNTEQRGKRTTLR